MTPLPLHDNYVSFEVDGGPFEGLLKIEIRKLERKANMTHRQALIWEWHLRGLANDQIADVLAIDESTVRQALDVAFAKAEAAEYRGVLTAMVESQGWRAVMELLRDREEAEWNRRKKKFEREAKKRLKTG